MRAESHYNRGRALETRRVHPGPGSGGRGVAPKLLLFVGDYDEKWMFRKFVRRRSINAYAMRRVFTIGQGVAESRCAHCHTIASRGARALPGPRRGSARADRDRGRSVLARSRRALARGTRWRGWQRIRFFEGFRRAGGCKRFN